MALQGVDPNILQIATICRTEVTANDFAVANSLLPRVPGVGQLGNRPPCTIRPNCTGFLYQCVVRGRSHYVRCTVCRYYKSTKNGGAFAGGQGQMTWFARIDIRGRPNVKLKTNIVLLITWCWSKGMSIKTTHDVLGDLVCQENDHTLIDWFCYLRELLIGQLNAAAPMGGPGQEVQIDENWN
uniref:Uncharacterized protein n=1 Tax=Romanomermis culicivorax TaxID=13658 RepID=A0A915K890_ROMCU